MKTMNNLCAPRKLTSVLKSAALCGLATLTLCGSPALRPAAALPPEGGNPDPAPKPKPVYHADLHLIDAFRWNGFLTVVYIKNEGNAPSSLCTLGVRAYTNGNLFWVRGYDIPVLQPGQTAEIRVEPGFYLFSSGITMNFKADFYNTVIEWNESNNTDSFTNP